MVCLSSSHLLFLFLVCQAVAYAQRKPGLILYGQFSACVTKTSSLRLRCFYPPCEGNPPFHCEIERRGVLLASSKLPAANWTTRDTHFNVTESGCYLYLLNHTVRYQDTKTKYECKLSRLEETESRSITINYKLKKKSTRFCSSIGTLLHEGPSILWPAALLLSLLSAIS